MTNQNQEPDTDHPVWYTPNKLHCMVRWAETFLPPRAQAYRHDFQQWVQTHVKRKPHEPEFDALRELIHPGAVVLDLGANRGQSIDSMYTALGSKELEIHAFEPQRRLAARLAKRYPEVFVHQVGVGSGPGAIRLYTPVYRNYPFDGLTETGTAGPKWWMETFIWRYDNRYAHLDSEVVTIVRLDDLKLPHVDFIKVDVQGMEKPALFGANNLLERDHPVLMVETPDDELTYWLSHLGYEAFHWVNYELVPAVPLAERFVLNTIFVHPSHWFRLRVRR